MKNRYHSYETLFYLALTLLCVLYCFFAFQMPFGKPAKPGQGFFPVILSLMGAALSASAAVDAYRAKKKPGAEEARSGVDFSGAHSVRLLIMYVAMIVFFILFANILGSYVCLLIMVFALAKIQGLPGLLKPALLAVCSIVLLYLVFNQFLGVLLPAGLLI